MKKLRNAVAVGTLATILIFGSTVASAETDNKVREMGQNSMVDVILEFFETHFFSLS